MASNVPFVKQVAWISLLPQLVVMGLIGLACYLAGAKENTVLYTGGLYVALSFTLRNVVAKQHREGIRLVKKQDYAGAILLFEASYSHFNENSWIDEYRYVTLLSSSRVCYREMALCNIAFCYSQIGEGKKAAEYYRQTLENYPENGVAQAGLRMLESAQK